MSDGCSLWVASFGSSRSASPAKRYLRWPKYRLPFSVWENRLAWENEGTEPQPAAAAVSCRSARSLRCLCSTSIARTTDQSALTDGLRLAGSGLRFRPRGGQIVDCDFRVSGRAADTARDRGIADGHSILCLLSQERPISPKAVSVVMSAGLQTSLLTPLSPSTQGRAEVRVIEPLPTCSAGLLHGWHSYGR